MVGKLKVGDQIRQTHRRFRNMDDFEAFINAIDQDYESEDAIFNGFIYKIDTPHLTKVNRSRYGNGCDFKNEIFEYRGNNSFIPTKGFCFVKCIILLTGPDYKQQYLDFIRSEQRRSNIMTMARIQPCLIKLGIDLGYYNGERIFPRSVTERNNALYFYINHFCLTWKSANVSFSQAIQEFKKNFKIFDNYISEENVNSHLKYEFIPKKIESHLTNSIVYDVETHNTDGARPYGFCSYRLSKLAGRYNRDLTSDEIDNCKKDTIAFYGDNFVEGALDFCLKLKEENKDKRGKFLEYNL